MTCSRCCPLSEAGDDLLGEAIARVLPPFVAAALPQATGLGGAGRRVRRYLEAYGWRVEKADSTTVSSEWLTGVLTAMVQDDVKPPTTAAEKAEAYDRICERINRRNRGKIL